MNKHLSLATLAMIILVAASNFLVEIPINKWLTYGALSYPFTFLVTELTNFHYGPKNARRVVYIGFIIAIIFGFLLMNKQIALASSTAFLLGQLLDITVFSHLRKKSWWIAPLFASVLASTLDTFLFFGIAFFDDDWLSLALGDLGVKLIADLCLLAPFRIALRRNLVRVIV